MSIAECRMLNVDPGFERETLCLGLLTAGRAPVSPTGEPLVFLACCRADHPMLYAGSKLGEKCDAPTVGSLLAGHGRFRLRLRAPCASRLASWTSLERFGVASAGRRGVHRE